MRASGCALSVRYCPRMRSLYPEIEAGAHGYLDVGAGHAMYWETCGSPDGKPALTLHGGPGSGCAPWNRRLFDPRRYRMVLYDQRNAGRSAPHASEPDVDLSTNTTHRLEVIGAHEPTA